MKLIRVMSQYEKIQLSRNSQAIAIQSGKLLEAVNTADEVCLNLSLNLIEENIKRIREALY